MNERMLEAYLNKIEMTAPKDLNRAYLKLLHASQHTKIPFENLDIVNGNPILLSEEALFNKLVMSQRGGYCFELNGLLLNALIQMGFEARALLARVHLAEEPSGRSHQVTLVTLEDEKWVLDAGFGSQTPREPLPYRLNEELKTDSQTFRFVEDKFYGAILQIKTEEESWLDLYSLDMSYVCKGDIEYANHYTSTHPNSAFTSRCIATIRNHDGITTLLNGKVKVKTELGVTEYNLDTKDTYMSTLKDTFGIDMDIKFKTLTKYDAI
jgi:N-hydroxyarylamine O-acetyltransferase